MAVPRFVPVAMWISLLIFCLCFAHDPWDPYQEACDNLLFTPSCLFVKGSCYAFVITSIASEGSHLKCHHHQHWWPASINCYWLLLLAGNVEVNPGPANTLKCYLLNARSVVNKSLDVHAFLHSQNVDVLAVTETFLSDAITDGELVGCGYSVFRRDRNRHCGEVLLIIKDSIAATWRQDIEIECELLWVEIASSPSSLLLGVFYSPTGFRVDALLQLQSSLTSLPNTLPIVLCADLHIYNGDHNT